MHMRCFFNPCRYDERIDRVETRIAARLRDQLGTAKSANEMFRIFSRYNALFVRAHIRGAIREYQTQLIQRVKDDIEALHSKFKVGRSIMSVWEGAGDWSVSTALCIFIECCDHYLQSALLTC